MSMRIISIAVGTVMAIPMIVMTVWGAQVSMYTHEAMAVNQQIIDGTDDQSAYSTIPDIPRGPLDWLRDRRERNETTSATDLNNNRKVTIVEYHTISDVMQPDEALPNPAYQDVFMAARAPGLMINACENVLRTMATKCDVLGTDVTPIGTNLYRVRAYLAYAPDYDLGDFSTVANGDFVNGYTSFAEAGYIHEYPADTPEQRAAYMTQAVEICGRLRAEYGNCTVANVQLDQRIIGDDDLAKLPPGTQPERLEGQVSYAIFVDETQIDRKQIRSRIEELGLHDGI